MDDISSHSSNDNYPLSKIKDSSYIYPSLPSSSLLLRAPKIAIWKDERLDYLEIPIGIVDVLESWFYN